MLAARSSGVHLLFLLALESVRARSICAVDRSIVIDLFPRFLSLFPFDLEKLIDARVIRFAAICLNVS